MSTQVNKLREDNNYYGDYGSQWLSNSDVKILLENPENFKKRRKADSNNLIYGSYFHALINEPDKVKDFVVIDSSRRGIKKFNEEFDSERFDSPYEVLLKKEAGDAEELANLMKSNLDFSEIIYGPGVQYEEPYIGEIDGVPFKCKVDVDMPGFIYDLKTTSDIHKFKRSAYIYGYDSQAYIYEKLTGKRFEFLVACKTNKILGRFDCSDEFILSGERKVERAIAVWREYFSEEKTKDINNFYINITL
jgi:hypothetical protein